MLRRGAGLGVAALEVRKASKRSRGGAREQRRWGAPLLYKSACQFHRATLLKRVSHFSSVLTCALHLDVSALPSWDGCESAVHASSMPEAHTPASGVSAA